MVRDRVAGCDRGRPRNLQEVKARARAEGTADAKAPSRSRPGVR